MQKIINVAIDGPAGAGKSTIAREAARRLGFVYIDTGAMYRAVGLCASRKGTNMDDPEALGRLMEDFDLGIKYVDGVQRVFLGEEDVSEDIRTPEMSMAASRVSAHAPVRAALVELQRSLAKKGSAIMDGRDICTHVLPDADVKIFLTASIRARAGRRLKELLEKGENVTLEEVAADMERRDYNDSHRENSPLVRADDAELIDTSELSLEESIETVILHIKEKTKDVL